MRTLWQACKEDALLRKSILEEKLISFYKRKEAVAPDVRGDGLFPLCFML